MTLKSKTWLMLAGVLSAFVAIALTVSYQQLQQASRDQLAYDARSIYEFAVATQRAYQQQFDASELPVGDETVELLPAHAFLRISKHNADWSDNGIVFASVSHQPINPRNRADHVEQDAIEWFGRNPDARERLVDAQADDGRSYILFAAPIRAEAACLGCHEVPHDATGDVLGLVSIRLPTSSFTQRVTQLWGGLLSQRLLEYAAVFVVIGMILDRFVVRRLSILRTGAQNIADGDYTVRASEALSDNRFHDSADEIGNLAATLDHVAEAVQNRDKELRKLHQALEQSPTNIVITSHDERIEYINTSVLQTTGFERHELIGATPRVLRSGKTPSSTYQQMWKALANGKPWKGEFINRRKDGSEYTEWANIAPVQGQDGEVTHYLAVKLDITEQKRAEAEIHRLAYYDPLTDLPNRRLFLERLQQALVDSQQHETIGALFIIDLDDFKFLNDSKGHIVGDQLLKTVSSRLARAARPGDTVARLGGDEYVMILNDLADHSNLALAAEQAEHAAERLADAIRKPCMLDDVGGYQVTASIGITLFSGTQQSTNSLLKQADVALYRAKRSGRDATRFFDAAMQTEISARITMKSALSSALANKEFRLYLQPQVDAQGQRYGAEALLRWQRADDALVPPLEFIPLAEETGLIIPIGEWVMHTACALLHDWSRDPERRQLSLAINVSPRQFRQSDFAARIADCLRKTDINPRRLRIELTESVVLDNDEEVVQRMLQLKRLGIRFSLDDFGTGYSSLSYLKRLPLDEIKIDKSFVRDIATNSGDAAIVGAILAISQSLGLEVVGEGVETAEQFAFLREHGCTRFQGYLFGRPSAMETET